MTTAEIEKIDRQAIEKIVDGRHKIKKEIAKVIVGQEEVIDYLLIALFCKGHCLFVGVPGLAKTLLVSTLADVLNLKFNRIQFTPDLMPADITGTDILEQDHATGKRFFKFIKGPIFSNILLADEINRTPPKTQAALLQSMQEYKVTASGTTYALNLPFIVFATQNPIEQEGTYPLPEAQLDRFMFQIDVKYPSKEEEIEIVRTTTSPFKPTVAKIFSPEEITSLQDLVTRVPVADYVLEYAIRLVRASRPTDPNAPDFVKKWISWGAGPRASQYLILGGKARALLDGRYAATCNDVRAIAKPILQHRIITNFNAEAEGKTSLHIIEQLLDTIKEHL
ncbi:MAG: MoxR family ATPase [Candidatus Brocadia sp. AMX2]|uniref:MoxR-like ATPase n=1 Tax=Candidatus Brocadia sinica JPN1 TaxID=1197129 RepID=A0ABQ0K035_9BACT|nr:MULTISPECIES: MoxR family ATPase [Brocadia]KXK32996.1 MAG: ATPase [Candidatus Brocadia sinica]MBC6932166.1 MoxR family ATPase [Candidatus Brocadia sp.]MBL1169435.1 MoxR family ATPase [Candidatus Brocadia sp. AMX1]NOG42254.1 MoxR family ATPase [Planctomycetota bacterium]KAA0245013.1 MAG: MoxR family ATPase [Candidatus Brocadia sp. AMX2]